MTLEERFEARRLARRRSQLIPWGAVLVALAVVVPRPLAEAAAGMTGPLRAVAFIATDVFRAGTLVGIGLLVIGKLRNRRWEREAKDAEQRIAPQP